MSVRSHGKSANKMCIRDSPCTFSSLWRIILRAEEEEEFMEIYGTGKHIYFDYEYHNHVCTTRVLIHAISCEDFAVFFLAVYKE